MRLFRASTDTEVKRPIPRDAAGWILEAEEAEGREDYARAVVCYRRALEHAPFSRDIRDMFEEAVERQSHAVLTKRASKKKEKPADQPLQERGESTPSAGKKGLATLFHEDFGAEESKAVAAGKTLTSKEADTRQMRPRAPRAMGERRRRQVTLMAAACAAILLTAGSLAIAAAATRWIGGIFSNDPLPVVVETKLPEALLADMQKAEELLTRGKAADAAAILRTARTAHPQHTDEVGDALVQALRVAGAGRLRDRDYGEAAKLFREATELNPTMALNWIDLGRSLRDHGRSSAIAANTTRQREVLKQAEEAFKQALDINKDDAMALLGLAQVYDARNERQQAMKTYQRIVEVAPKSYEFQLAEKALANLRK